MKSFKSLPGTHSKENWYFTGDLCYADEKGTVWFVGRKDDQMKIAGQRIELGDIEAALQTAFGDIPIFVVPNNSSQGFVDGVIAFTTEVLTSSDINRGLQSFIQKGKRLFNKKITTVNELPLLTAASLIAKRCLVWLICWGKGMTRKILITGGCGFIGVNLVEALLSSTNAVIRIVDDLSVGSPADHPLVSSFELVEDLEKLSDTKNQVVLQVFFLRN